MKPVVIIHKASQSRNTNPDWRLIDEISTGVWRPALGSCVNTKHFLSGPIHVFLFHDELNISGDVALMIKMMTMVNNNDNI